MKRIDENSLWTMPKAVKRIVRLPAVQVDGLPTEELRAALVYELEGATEGESVAAQIAWRSVEESDPAMRAFEVVSVNIRATGGRWLMILALILSAIAAAGIGLDYRWVTARAHELKVTVAKQRELQARLDLYALETRANRQARAAIRTAREQEVRVQEKAAAHRSAWAELLSALTVACGNEAVVRRIRPEGSYAANIEAVSLTPQEAVRVMVALTKALEPKHWKLTAGPLKTRKPGTTVLFSMSVEFTGGEQ